jgi:hypothetical protein
VDSYWNVSTTFYVSRSIYFFVFSFDLLKYPVDRILAMLCCTRERNVGDGKMIVPIY